jgi:hypothetical protein
MTELPEKDVPNVLVQCRQKIKQKMPILSFHSTARSKLYLTPVTLEAQYGI